MLTRPPVKAIRTRTAFRLRYAVRLQIRAAANRIWSILTDATDYPRWCTSVFRLQGRIEAGGRIRMRMSCDPVRVVELRGRHFEPPRSMRWVGGFRPLFQRSRSFALESLRERRTEFRMVESLSGLILPVIAPTLPDLRLSFDRFALDLKIEAERENS